MESYFFHCKWFVSCYINYKKGEESSSIFIISLPFPDRAGNRLATV